VNLRIPFVLGALLATLLVVGCGGTTGAGADAADVIPAGAPAFVSIDTDPDSSQWRTVERLAEKFPDREKAVRALKRELREEGLSWEEDVRPALGSEFDVVWLDFRNGGENFVGLVRPEDEEAFERVFAKADAKDKDKTFHEEVEGWQVIANEQALIDRFKRERESRERTLSDDPSFRQAMSRFKADSLARAWVSGDELMDTFRRYTGGDPQVDEFVEKLGTLDWIGASLRALDTGVRFDTAVHGTPGSMLKGQGTSTFAPKQPSRTPEDALVYFTFHGSSGMFAGLTQNPLFATPEARPFAQLLSQIGKLIAGEDALYVRPGRGRIPEVTLVTEPQAGTNGAATLDRILRRFRQDLGVVPRSTRIAGRPGRVLDFGDFAVYYANVGRRLVLSDLPAGIAGAAVGGKPLTSSETYRDALSSSGMPRRTHGFVYVDVRSGVELVDRLSGAPIPAEVRRNLKPLRSAVEYVASRSRELRITFFLRIQ
jgi:hypothetical protein